MLYSTRASTPRGIRNNNPLNIERTATQWIGMAPYQADQRFITFDSPAYGIRAAARILKTYETKHGLNTVAGIINRWAPPIENDSGAYIEHVAKYLGVAPNEQIDVSARLPELIAVMTVHENGINPYSPELIAQGVALA